MNFPNQRSTKQCFERNCKLTWSTFETRHTCRTLLKAANRKVNRKTWCEGPYGREKQLADQPPPNNRNWLTTEATARLFTEIVTGRAVTPERSRQMLELHQRQPFDTEGNAQSREYTGAVLPPGSKLWSKAGWTSEVRHDAAYVELPTGERFILVTFTTGESVDNTTAFQVTPVKIARSGTRCTAKNATLSRMCGPIVRWYRFCSNRISLST